MPRRKAPEVEEDEDYDPNDSFDDGRRVKQKGSEGAAHMFRSSRGRPVKARQYTDDSETEEDEVGPSHRRAAQSPPEANHRLTAGSADYRRPTHQQRSKPAKRQRWVPHNPLILGGMDEDDDSKDPQISDDDDESGEEGASRSRRRTTENCLKGVSVPVRDESGKFIGVRSQTPAERRQDLQGTGMRGQGGGGIFKSAAVSVLREERRLMSTGEIARIALKRGYVKVQGRTPEATMASAMYTDVKRKEDRSTFIRPHEGLFGLREWLEEGANFKDPLEDKYPDESTQAVLRRSRLSSTQNMARANSRGSGGATYRSGRQRASPAPDPFLPASSQNSHRADPIFDRDEFPPDLPEIGSKQAEELAIGRRGGYPLAAAAAAGSTSHTPFGSSRGGPSPEIFKSRFGDGRSGFVPTGKRSLSGSGLQGFQRANSAGLKHRKLGSSMSQQDSGNMLLLLSAVEDVKSMDRSAAEAKRQSGLLPRGLGPSGPTRRHLSSGHGRRDGDSERPPQLTVQGFNATRIAAVQQSGASQAASQHPDQVNILNLPLPEILKEEGSLETPEVPPPGVEVDPSTAALRQSPSRAQNATPPPGAEAALQALDSAFASAPLKMTGSLSGPLAPAIRIPSELLTVAASLPDGALESVAAAAASNAMEAAAVPSSAASAQTIMPPPNGSGGETSAAATPSHEAARAPAGSSPVGNGLQAGAVNAMPDFGPPEVGAKRLPEVEAAVRAMEASLGDRHPKVGKGYLYLSRVYQCMATPEYYNKAQHALHHAYEICFACQKPPQ